MPSTLGTHEAVTRLRSCRRANNILATYVYAACTHHITGNVLIGSDDGELVLIDFEYAAYNYRFVWDTTVTKVWIGALGKLHKKGSASFSDRVLDA